MKEIEGWWVELADGKTCFIPEWLVPVIDQIAETYKYAVTAKHIKKPKAYALYHSWKEQDKTEKARKGNG